MASKKKGNIDIVLLVPANGEKGNVYSTTINRRNRAQKGAGKLRLKKYNRLLRRHIEYVQTKS